MSDNDITSLIARVEELEKLNYKILLERIENVERLFEEHKANFYHYMKRHSEIEELEDRNYILNFLQNEKKGYVSTVSLMRNFYYPTSNNLLTDFDGLILMEPILEKHNNSKPLYNGNNRHTFRKTMKNRLRQAEQTQAEKTQIQAQAPQQPCAIIIESKQKFDKGLIDKKLQQFYEIYKILKSIKDGSLDITNTSDNFKQLYENYNLQNFPNELYFVFSSNSINKKCIEYIQHIAQKTLTRELYELYTIDYLRTLPIFDEFCRPKHITKQYIKDMNTTTSLAKIFKILDQYATNKYSMKLRNEIVLYEDMEQVFEYISGRTGLHVFDNLYIPTIIGEPVA